MKHRLFTVITVAAVLALASPVLAQETPARATGGGGIYQSETEPRVEHLEFPGGTVSEYVAVIREHCPEANIVLMGNADQFVMPPMKTRDLSLGQLIALIRETAQGPQGSAINVKSIGHNLHVVQVYMPSPPQQPRPVDSLVISLADVITDELRDRDIFMSIETAMELFSEVHPQARFRYHEPTQLLIARGHPEQMDHIRTIVGELRGAVRARYGAAPVAPQTQRIISDLRARVRDLEHQNTSLEAALHQCLEDREASRPE